MGEKGGPSPEEMGIENPVPIGSAESDVEYVQGPDGKPTDVIKPKAGKELPPAPPDIKGII